MFYSLFKKSLEDGYFLYSKNSAVFTLEENLPKKLLKTEITKENKILYLAFSEKKIIGYLLANKPNGGVAFGHWLAVDANYRKHGVASKILSTWEKDAFKQGAHKLDLYTTRNDVEFYKNRGFILAGECPDCWFGVDHFWLYKTLRKSEEKLFLKEFLKSKKSKAK